jgi:hypothetical protein
MSVFSSSPVRTPGGALVSEGTYSLVGSPARCARVLASLAKVATHAFCRLKQQATATQEEAMSRPFFQHS